MLLSCSFQEKEVNTDQDYKSACNKLMNINDSTTIKFPKSSMALIDSNLNQIFIDTSHSSLNEISIRNWNFRNREEYINEYIGNLKNTETQHELYRSTKLTQLRRFGTKFYLYDRSDGMDRRYEVSRNYFIYYGIHEFDHFVINRDMIFNEETLESTISTNRGYKIKTKLIADPMIYKLMIFQNDKLIISDFVTHSLNVKSFNSLINFTPKYKGCDLL